MYARISALLVAFALALTGLVSAQETTGTINGRLMDAQNLPVPGVTVTVTGPQGARSVTTDTEGRYSAGLLTPGTYTVRAELQGFKATEATGVTVSLGQTATVNLKMEVGGVTETVQVTGAAATVDTQSTTTGAVLDPEMLSRIPVGRRITDALYVAPGVSSGGSVGRANPSFSGGSGLDNLYVIDGVNVSNTGYGAIGSYSIVFGSLGTGIPFDFAQEIQVKTGGYEAEFGQSMGGIMNIVTKSGTNQPRGAIYAFTRPQSLEGDWKTAATDDGVANTVGMQNSDIGGNFGYRIIPDRVFFYGAASHGWERRTFLPLKAVGTFPLASLSEDERSRERRLWSYSAKGTFQITPTHRVDASFFGDPSRGLMGPQRTSSLLNADTSSFSEIDFGGHNQTVRYDGVMGTNTLVEVSFSRAKNTIEELPSVDEWRITDQRTAGVPIVGGIGLFEAGNVGENLQYSAKATNLIGGHSVKYGVLYEDITFDQIQKRTGPSFTAPDGRQTASGASISILPDVNFGQIYRVTRALFNEVRNTRQDYFAFFAQDSWRTTDRLTVNAGLRYEQQHIFGAFDELPVLGGGTVDNLALKNNWAPRVGVVYDVLGNGRSKLFLNYGRFFARVPNDIAARIFSSDESITRGDYFDAALTQPIPDGVATQTSAEAAPITQHFIAPGGGEAHTFVDPDSKLSAKDEIATGFEWEAFPNTSVGVRYIYRNISRVIEDVGLYPHVACDLGSAGACAFDTYVVTNPNSDTQVILDAPGLIGRTDISFDDPRHRYHAVELTMDRRFSNNWSVLASYRWSRLRGNYEGFFREDNGQSDPGLTSLYDYPTNDPTYAEIGVPQFGYTGDVRFLGVDGILPLDRPHQLKIFGNYAWDSGLSLGLGLNGTSGKPLTALGAHPNYQNDSEIPITARGEGFDTVDGFKKRTPAEWQVDMQASYSLNFAGNRRLTLLADAFNIFNIRRPFDYNAAFEEEFQSLNPDFGTVTSQNVSGQMYQTPFQLRFGARFGF